MNDYFGPNVEFRMSSKRDGPMNIVGHEHFDAERRANRAAFFSHMGVNPKEAVYPKPVHTARAEIVEQYNPIYGSLMCDAVITGKKNLALTMTAGDCPPVALYDPVNEVIALVHCGWRPLVAGILEHTIEKMVKELNCYPANIKAFIGPGICPSCYEVKMDVWSKFFPGQDPPAGKLYLSLQAEITKRLLAQGLRLTSLPASEECTMHTDDGEKYYSWRRDKDDPLACQMAVLVMR